MIVTRTNEFGFREGLQHLPMHLIALYLCILDYENDNWCNDEDSTNKNFFKIHRRAGQEGNVERQELSSLPASV